MISCIYEIRNKINNKVYIGSTIDFKQRKATHLKELRRGKHANSHLQNAWNKYGEDNFIFKIIERCSIENLLIREQYYINLFYGENCYNIQKIACN
ncbi:MAG: GIY-YIG nuclease family protein, partial [Parvimonas sp.]|nr:GIY-YIG nuclease family protein [Parvimonas sp.]